MSSVELLYDHFQNHGLTAKSVAERRPLFFGFSCFLIGGVSLFVAQALSERLAFFSFSWISCGLAALGQVVSGFLMVSILHLFLEMGGSRGSAAALFVLFGMAKLAWAVAIPLLILARLFAPYASWAMPAVFFAAAIGEMHWRARAIADVYRVGPGKAWLILGLPYAVLIAVAGLLAALILAGLTVRVLHYLGG